MGSLLDADHPRSGVLIASRSTLCTEYADRIEGRLTAADLAANAQANGGKATLTTVAGETLTFTEVQGNIKVDGTQGSSGFITQPDVEQSNGNIHVINGVLMPTLG